VGEKMVLMLKSMASLWPQTVLKGSLPLKLLLLKVRQVQFHLLKAMEFEVVMLVEMLI
jgi:hypothetical protein